MQLEDHVGDIIRKARAMSGVSTAAAAIAAEISESDLAAIEAAGTISAKINFIALGKITGLHPRKLTAIANGWQPSPKNLGLWRELRMFTTRDDALTVNCYLVWDVETRTAALFDTGFEATMLLETIAAEKLVLKHIFITHSHWDHVEALPQIRAAWPEAQAKAARPPSSVATRSSSTATVGLESRL